MTPGRKFSTTTSALAASFSATARPSGLATSSASERLPRLPAIALADSPPRVAPA